MMIHTRRHVEMNEWISWMDGASDCPVRLVSWTFVPSKQRIAARMRSICGTSTYSWSTTHAYEWIDEWKIDTTGKWRIHLRRTWIKMERKKNRIIDLASTPPHKHMFEHNFENMTILFMCKCYLTSTKVNSELLQFLCVAAFHPALFFFLILLSILRKFLIVSDSVDFQWQKSFSPSSVFFQSIRSAS